MGVKESEHERTISLLPADFSYQNCRRVIEREGQSCFTFLQSTRLISFVAFFFDYQRGGGLFVLNIYLVDKERGDFEGWKRVAALA